MILFEHDNLRVRIPTSGGKAGKGCQVTTSIQVLRGWEIVGNFRFRLDCARSRARAVAKAQALVVSLLAPVRRATAAAAEARGALFTLPVATLPADELLAALRSLHTLGLFFHLDDSPPSLGIFSAAECVWLDALITRLNAVFDDGSGDRNAGAWHAYSLSGVSALIGPEADLSE